MGTRQRLILHALLAAGSDGVTSTALARLAGHHFAGYIAQLRRSGADIKATPLTKNHAGEWIYRLTNSPPALLGEEAPIPSLPITVEKLSARRAYLLIRSALEQRSVESVAMVVELLRWQPELVSSNYIRHNLGTAKTALLEHLAKAAGSATP